jgi:hypothetical protein
MQLGISALTSLADARYPQILTDPAVSSLVTREIFNRTQWVLMVADIWCWWNPVSNRLLGNFQSNTKIMWVDSNYGDTAIAHEKEHKMGNITFYSRDIRDTKQLRQAKWDFFEKYKSFWKQKFDVIILSNITNYITGDWEELDPGEISDKLYNFIEKFIVRNLAKKWVLVIQNGDKWQTDTRFERPQVNEYFSRELEELLRKYLEDFFYLWVAWIEPHSW